MSQCNSDDIDRIIAEAADSADEDAVRRELADAKNQAESLLYTSERALDEFGEVLGEEERASLVEDLAECKRVIEEGNVEDVREAIVRLEASAQRIGEILYEGVGDDGGGGVEMGGCR